MATSLPTIPVPAKAYEALAAIVDLGRERVTRLAALVSAKRGTVHLPNLTGVIHEWAQELEIPEEVLAKAITGVIIPVNSLRTEYDLSQPAFVEAFRNSVEQRANSEWKKKYADKWPEIADALVPMFAPDNFFSMAIKTAQLLGSQPAIFLDAKVLTELRPIYDEAADNIRTLLMTNTLVLTYSRNGSPQTIHVAMDLDDLQTMLATLQRASKNNSVAEDHSQKWGVSVLSVTHEES
jgi:hypothetical protein